MKTLKTAEELFEIHRPKGALSVNRPMYFSNFLKALTEHDKEIRDKIGEMELVPYKNLGGEIEETDAERAYREGYNKALTELLNWLKEK